MPRKAFGVLKVALNVEESSLSSDFPSEKQVSTPCSRYQILGATGTFHFAFLSIYNKWSRN